jgi:excisionase family DNA binding protein
MTVAEAAARAVVSEKTVYRAIAAGRLKASRIGRCLRITERAFEDWIVRGEVVVVAQRSVSRRREVARLEAGSLERLRAIESEAA